MVILFTVLIDDKKFDLELWNKNNLTKVYTFAKTRIETYKNFNKVFKQLLFNFILLLRFS